LRKVLLASLVAFAAVSANAEIFDVVGTGNSNNRANIEFNYASQSSLVGRVDITVRNSSIPNGQGGSNPAPHLTGIMFNLPAQIFSLLSYTLPAGWAAYPTSPILGLLPPLPDGAVRPPGNVGAFDMCAETQGANGNCSGGGPAGPRLSVGEAGAFSFVFSGLNMTALNTMSFLSLLSSPINNNSTTSYFAVRFQTTTNGSDMGLPTGDMSPVPEPGTVGMVGLAASLLVLARRRLTA
jgi:hypothetical protein